MNSAYLIEEAVQEVKRQAMIELHKAVATAETKANNMVNQERAKMERTIQEIRKQTRDEVIDSVNHQEESSEVKVPSCGVVSS